MVQGNANPATRRHIPKTWILNIILLSNRLYINVLVIKGDKVTLCQFWLIPSVHTHTFPLADSIRTYRPFYHAPQHCSFTHRKTASAATSHDTCRFPGHYKKDKLYNKIYRHSTGYWRSQVRNLLLQFIWQCCQYAHLRLNSVDGTNDKRLKGKDSQGKLSCHNRGTIPHWFWRYWVKS